MAGPVKRDFLVISFFAVGATMVPIYRDSNMHRLRTPKKLITAAWPKWGPGFSTVLIGDQHKATAFSCG